MIGVVNPPSEAPAAYYALQVFRPASSVRLTVTVGAA